MCVYSGLSYPLPILKSWPLVVTFGVLVSGQNVLAMAREAGADISDAVNKCAASTSKQKHMKDYTNSVVNPSLPD